MKAGLIKSTLLALLTVLVASALTLSASAASISCPKMGTQTASRGVASAHVVQVGHKKKKKHKKKHHTTPLLGSDFGSVPLGKYQAAYDLSYTGFSSGWVNTAQYTLSSSLAAAFKAGINSYNTNYSQECDKEGTSLGISNWSCSLTYQTWNGTSFGFTFSASGTTPTGATYSSTIAVRYTKIS
ncbi:MAG: hypothetical protein WB867_06755 [Candidatus Dormiibacterota bacterium]